MSETLQLTRRQALFAEVERALRELAALDHTGYSDDDAVSAIRDHERLRRLIEPVDHALILDIERRGIPARALARGTGGWLRAALTIDIHEATARVRAAHAAGTRRTLLGQPLPARYPAVAAAQADGQLAARQARVITCMLDKLPDTVLERVPEVEAALVDSAQRYDASALQKLADRHRDWLDPDGTLDDVEKRRRERDLRFTQRPDGSCTGSFEGTAELAEVLQVAFDSLGAPTPETNGVKDPRSAGQRRHDALLDALKITVGSGSLEKSGGVLATIILTMTAQDYATGTGFASTGHGAQVPTREAMSWAGGDYRLFLTVLDSVKGITAYSSTHRLFTEGQRLAMIARDGGCAFPGCLAPPGWCQAAHIIDYINGGPTTVANGMLLCGFHHREYVRQGWTVRLVDGRPEWTPPRWIDPEQKPIRS
ncbi:DUF222 domain-containing protein [uncultured Jatrophihabitans sp.]|uniref:HNH endonuclease signature motif containing protein n=1 Tax=uncultured Jatrophihabitans sp. TaxID=1610747 RepID=UPI0035CB19DD